MSVGLTPRPRNGLSCSQHPDQLTSTDHAWAKRLESRSGGVPWPRPLQWAWEARIMHVVYPVCCGIDVPQAQLTACLRRVSPEGQITTERRDCGTTYQELLVCSD
jgi:hypothetical protein